VQDHAPPDRFCDVVMKGGITSGVVYPPAIYALAEHYKFKNIGGTSAGAIAAAVAAAAEFRRRKQNSMEGFDRVRRIPDDLWQPGWHGQTQLFRLFQPDWPCRRLFHILASSLNATGTINRILRIAWGCIRAYWIAAAIAIVGSALAMKERHYALSALWFLLTFFGLIGIGLYWDVTRRLVKNNYGLCKGMTTDSKAGPGLTEWLHQLIQETAGLPVNRPLTFGDLWGAPGGPSAHAATGVTRRSIDLQIFTTNLAHGRPYIFPHTEPTARLFFNEDELAPYLPPDVLKWLHENALEYVPAPAQLRPGRDPDLAQARALKLKEIPPPEKFPVLLAARMSLSFPLLFSAVPLWAIDYEQPADKRSFARCMFSDGGISSNFPVHLFDGLIPQWPTFGIDLEPKPPGHSRNDEQRRNGSDVFLPHRYLEGLADQWVRFDAKPNSASRLGGFFMSIPSTMQNWNDNIEARSAGVRHRVVRVYLADDEGGMNLKMDKNLITNVARRGADAGDALIDRYLRQAGVSVWDGWSSQRWIRLDTFLYSLGQKIGGMGTALGATVPHAKPYATLITDAQAHTAPGHTGALTPQQAVALGTLTAALQAATSAFGVIAPPYPPADIPLPDSELRAKSPL
jgi:predicted acylesterase/phospholipase RssA